MHAEREVLPPSMLAFRLKYPAVRGDFRVLQRLPRRAMSAVWSCNAGVFPGENGLWGHFTCFLHSLHLSVTSGFALLPRIGRVECKSDTCKCVGSHPRRGGRKYRGNPNQTYQHANQSSSIRGARGKWLLKYKTTILSISKTTFTT